MLRVTSTCSTADEKYFCHWQPPPAPSKRWVMGNEMLWKEPVRIWLAHLPWILSFSCSMKKIYMEIEEFIPWSNNSAAITWNWKKLQWVTIKSSGTTETTGEKPRVTVKNFAMYFSNCESLKTNLSAAFSERKEARMMLATRLRGKG